MAILGNRRLINAAGALACIVLLGSALYLQNTQGLEPCPLCVFQRLGIGALGAVFLLAALHHPGARGARVYGVAILLAAGAAAALAGRHVYIQSLPPGRVPACGATLDYMLDVLPINDVIRKVLTGSGECAVVDWSLLGLSMPAWVLVAATVLGLSGVIANLVRPK